MITSKVVAFVAIMGLIPAGSGGDRRPVAKAPTILVQPLETAIVRFIDARAKGRTRLASGSQTLKPKPPA